MASNEKKKTSKSGKSKKSEPKRLTVEDLKNLKAGSGGGTEKPLDDYNRDRCYTKC